LKEAHRILRPNGIIKIAEVRSRFEGEKNGIKKFVRTLKKAGFDCVHKDFDNKMFFILECIKVDRIPIFDDLFSPKACLYKKR
jgi:ribosomal RNA-processing protein 8